MEGLRKQTVGHVAQNDNSNQVPVWFWNVPSAVTSWTAVLDPEHVGVGISVPETVSTPALCIPQYVNVCKCLDTHNPLESEI